MSQITLYLWGDNGLYSGSVSADPHGPLPPYSTLAAPPETSGTEVAQWNGAGWVVLPERPIVPVPPEDWPAAIAARRYQAEIAGITVNGLSIDTPRDSQSLITGAALQATLDSTYTCRWKTAGGFVDLSAQQILDLATAVRAHVQACFDREAELLDQLAAGTLTPNMLEQGWPQ